MASTMEQSSSRRNDEHPEFNLTEWGLKARIRHQNTASRRYSASYITNYRENNTTSFRSNNLTISSTASSPGCCLKDGIDPSTYSFTAALKALQARNLECSPVGFALNSKWNEAEKYICNPLSGEFPMECLSAKTLSARSFRKLTNKITISAPLVYSSTTFQEDIAHLPIPEVAAESLTRNVGTQSSPPPDLSSGSLSPVSTPSVIERALNRCGNDNEDSPLSNTKSKSDEQVEVKETKDEANVGREDDKIQTREKDEANVGREDDKIETREKDEEMNCNCLSWVRKRQRNKHKYTRKIICFFPHFKGC